MNFEFPEDYDYFAALFVELGGIEKYTHLFDFRPPSIKLKAYHKIHDEVRRELIAQHGPICQLKYNLAICTNTAAALDHLIPRSSNVLNKLLRQMKGGKGKKVPSQSFGSNHRANLILACEKCNGNKKHQIPKAELLARILL